MDWQRKTVSGWSEAKSGLSDNEVQAQSAGATGNCGNAPMSHECQIAPSQATPACVLKCLALAIRGTVTRL